MKIWVVVAVSCSECNSMGVRSFDHQPSEDEVSSVVDKIGGMYCIRAHTFETKVNGVTVEQNIDD
jgi:hypothetical protein